MTYLHVHLKERAELLTLFSVVPNNRISNLKGYSTFFCFVLFEILAHFTTPPELNSWVLPFSNVFSRLSKTRQFLVSLTSIVYFFPTMEVNETRNFLLNIKRLAEWI